MKKLHILFGIRPTSENIHLGHILVLNKIAEYIKNHINEYDEFDVSILLAEYHALTTGTDEKKKEIYDKLYETSVKLYQQITNYLYYKILNEYNINTENIYVIYRSQIRDTNLLENYVLIQNVMSYSEITSIPTIKEYKENMKKNEYLSAGFINYPLLQIADIITINPDIIFVGKDQQPNMKILKKVINKLKFVYPKKFNYLKDSYNVIYVDNILKGYDCRKMSKSYNNVISFGDDDADIKNKIMLYQTDGHSLSESGNYIKCMFYDFIKNFLNDKEIESLQNYCTQIGSKCKLCKEKYGSKILYLKNKLIS